MKIKKIGELEEGKTYHVTVGDKNHEPTANQVQEVKKRLTDKNPKITFVVTPYYIKIGTKKAETTNSEIVEDIDLPVRKTTLESRRLFG